MILRRVDVLKTLLEQLTITIRELYRYELAAEKTLLDIMAPNGKLISHNVKFYNEEITRIQAEIIGFDLPLIKLGDTVTNEHGQQGQVIEITDNHLGLRCLVQYLGYRERVEVEIDLLQTVD